MPGDGSPLCFDGREFRRLGKHHAVMNGRTGVGGRRGMVAALAARACSTEANASTVTGARMFVVPRGRKVGSLVEKLPDGIVSAQQHCLTSDVNRALEMGTTAFPKSQMLGDRHEGRFLASAEIDGKWFAVSKTILTEVIGQGLDALIVDVPEPVIDALRVTYPGLMVVVDESVPGRGEAGCELL